MCWHQFIASPVDEAAHTVTASTPHFTDVARVPRFYITPKRSAIEPNQSTSLTLLECSLAAYVDPDHSSILHGCFSSKRFASWSANGVHGGDDANGTLTIFEVSGANYKAPSKTPSPNPVKIQAEVSITEPLPKQTFFADAIIDVGGKPTWVGSASVEQISDIGGATNHTKTTGVVTFTWNEGKNAYTPAGSVTMDIDAVGVDGCTTKAHYGGIITTADGTLTVNGGTYNGSGYIPSITYSQMSDCNSEHEMKTTQQTGPAFWWAGGSGVVSGSNGQLISGNFDVSGQKSTWSFEKY